MIKKVILLVDSDNCKFLIVKKDNCWNLPVVDNTNDIKKEFFNIYNINIDKINVIKEEEDYVVVKCITNDKFDNVNYNEKILNEIYPMISDQQQKKLIFDISTKIFMETINDSFWLGIILSVEDAIDNYKMNAILTDFLLFFSSIFCIETINYKFGEIKDNKYVSSGEIKKLRKSYLKECPLYNSNNIKSIINSMGINFDNYVFDIVVFLLDGKIIDINSRTWNKKNKTKFELYNGIVMSPRNWIKNLLPELYEYSEDLRKIYVEQFKLRFNEIKIEEKSYSTYKIFDKSMSYDEKIYILQRIGLLKTIMLISNKFGNGNYITLNEQENITLSFDKFLIKAKATIIELIWNDSKNNIIPFLKNILDKLTNKIDTDFYKINRKYRDNIHYGFYNEITDSEYKILKKNQDIYLNYIIVEFEKKLNYKFNFSYKIALGLAKLQNWFFKGSD